MSGRLTGRLTWIVALGGLSVGIALIAATGNAHSAYTVAACRGQVRFLTTKEEGVSSVEVEYGLRLKNVGHAACVAPRFLTVEVPRGTPAPIATHSRFQEADDLRPLVRLTRPLIVRPGESIGGLALLDTPCGHIIGTNVTAKITFVIDEWPVHPKTSITAYVCRHETNEVELFALDHRR